MHGSTSVSVHELKQALKLELRTLENNKAALDEERLRLGWRAGLRYIKGGSEAGYEGVSEADRLAGQIRRTVGGEAFANARAALDNMEFLYERTSKAVQAHNLRLQNRGLIEGILCAPFDYWRAARLARQWEEAKQRRADAKNAFQKCNQALEGPEHQDRVSSLAYQYRFRESELAVRRQGVELRRAMLVDELELRWSMLRRLKTLPDKMSVPVRHTELSAAIKDPELRVWLRGVGSPD